MEYSISGQESKQCVKVMLGANPNLSNQYRKNQTLLLFHSRGVEYCGKDGSMY